jgi:putative ABC transport system substrate-binding protein
VITRRAFSSSLGATVLAGPLVAQSQPAGKVWRIGVLQFPSREQAWPLYSRLKDGLKELGFVEGLNVVFEERFADGARERLSVLAAELVRLSPDVIFAQSNEVLEAARHATGTIPIVTALVNDPVGRGLIASLARPGGNITGLTFDVDDRYTGSAWSCLGMPSPRRHMWRSFGTRPSRE